MTRSWIRFGALVLAALFCLAVVVAAQEPAPQEPPPVESQAPPPSAKPVPPPRPPRSVRPVEPVEPVEPETPEPSRDFDDYRRWNRDAFRLGGMYRLRADDDASEVFVISGETLIEGRVYDEMVQVLGTAQIASTAVIEGSLVVVGGKVTIEPGARIDRDLVVIGGELQAPADFAPGGEHVVIGPDLIGGRLDGLVPWATQGLLWGRPIVPSLGWVWSIVALFFLAYLALNVLFDRPVRACASMLSQKPLSAFLTGLVVLLLAGPVILLLGVSVVGLVVVPFAVGALLLAWILGKVGVARWLGMRVLPEEGDALTAAGQRSRSVRSFVIGFAIITVAYMIPVVGILAWGTVGVLGLGAATMAFMAGYRRENPFVPRARRAASAGPSTYEAPGVRPQASDLGPSAFADATAGQQATDPLPPFASPHASFEETSGPDPTLPPTPPPYSQPLAAAPAIPAADLASFPHATFRDRLAAFVLDVILVMLTVVLLDLSRGPDEEQRILFLLLAYHIGFWTWKGTTVGGIICQLRVIRVNGEPVRFIDALVRGLASILSLVALGLGGLWILTDPERQAWHDKVAGTYVVKVPRHYPL
jgi:uncharacterized RDD family membrane protein YckC